MDKVKSMIEGYERLTERKQLLYSRLLNLDGSDPLQDESIYNRLEKVEEEENLIMDMIFNTQSLTNKDISILNMRSQGAKPRQIGEFFHLTRETIRKSLEDSYKKIAAEFQDEVS